MVTKKHKKPSRDQNGEAEKLEERIKELEKSPSFSLFSELPLSSPTLRGVKQANFNTLTPIQARAIPLALRGLDVLGAARTGSGKTLAFLIPMLECLVRKKWSAMDGLGALVISPTRELAVQIFTVLRSIGSFHSFSAGLIIGGKNLAMERQRMSTMNILIATPGRLLQHMDQTVDFQADNLQILVLDEADRILDMGFAATLNAIVAHLPETRQTLLFSATQTKSIKDLARLSLKDPEFVAVRESNAQVDESDQVNVETPAQLQQHYTVVGLPSKMDALWSFIKLHLYHKTLVFLSSCKQVRFVYETFRHLRPGVPLLHLHGKQKQMHRLEVYEKFANSEHAVLFATDIAARGLDFPDCGWVVQVDCPEDVETYIHRVGRTARYDSKGRALLFLCPSEEAGMLKRFEKKGLKVESIKLRENKQQSTHRQLQSLAFRSTEIKYLAQTAFSSYARSIHLQKDKGVFKFNDYPLDEFAASLGLVGAPQIRFTTKSDAFQKKNAVQDLPKDETSAPVADLDQPDSEEDEQETMNVFGNAEASTSKGKPNEKQTRTRMERMFQRKNQDVLSAHYGQVAGRTSEKEADDDFMTIKRTDHALEELPADVSQLSNRKLKAGTSKKAMLGTKGLGSKLMFDDDGSSHPLYELQTEDDFKKAGDARQQVDRYVQEERATLRTRDVGDKARVKEVKREKKRKRKEHQEQHQFQAELAPMEDDGYVSPTFDLPADETEEQPIFKKMRKRTKET